MVRRYRKRSRKLVIRKRRYRKRFNKKRTTYDGVYYAKIHLIRYMKYGSLAGCGWHVVGWGQSGTQDNYTSFLSNAPEWDNLNSIFAMYRLKGLKMTVETASEVTGGGRAYFSVAFASYPTQTAGQTQVEEAKMMQQADYKIHNSASLKIKKYISLGKFYGKRDEKWLPTSSQYAPASTAIRMDASGQTDGDNMAKIKFTWYVAFKNYNYTGVIV